MTGRLEDRIIVLIGGGISRAGERRFHRLLQFLEVMEWRPGGHRVRILPALLSEFARALGAAHQAMEEEIFHE